MCFWWLLDPKILFLVSKWTYLPLILCLSYSVELLFNVPYSSWGILAPHSTWGGGKSAPLSKIVPENTCMPKNDQNVVQLFYFWVPSKKFRWRRHFCLFQHFLGHNWHFSGKNTLFTKYIIKIQHEICLTCMIPHFLAI